jgi:hypothetical protein
MYKSLDISFDQMNGKEAKLLHLYKSNTIFSL